MNDSAASPGVLVIGASQAGAQLAMSLRELGWTAPITLIGAEKHPPYQRPPLSKKGLIEGFTPRSLYLRNDSYYADMGIALALNRRVTHVERDLGGSGLAFTDTGETFPFDRLALTVGARPRNLPVPGADLGGVMQLRSVEDAAELRERLGAASDVVIIGGGFIGLEVAATARQLRKNVTVVLADDRLMARAVGRPISSFYLDAHRRRGTQVLLSTRPAAMVDDGSGAVGQVELEDGRVLPADLVVVGVGAAPRTELGEQIGLEVADGIVVDERCLTSDGYTVAAGDCVQCPCPTSPVPGPGGPRRMRFESVNTAIEQAKVAAATVAGVPATYQGVPWFWSDQDTLKLQVAGLADGHDHYVVRGTPDDEAFAVLYYQNDRLIAAECVNRPADFLAVRAALNSGRTIDPVDAADLSTPLKRLQREFAGTIVSVPA
jgi:3-phenylpropionate/trans-cinnamate dioxygenase ferredoxin reductase component